MMAHSESVGSSGRNASINSCASESVATHEGYRRPIILLQVNDDESVPDPPAPRTPPAPSGAPVSPFEPKGSSGKDNPIAVAGLVISLLALVLSIVVLGGLIAFVSFVLCVIGLRRSKTIGRGRGLAIGGIVLSILSVLASAAALAILIATINGGDEVSRNGIVTTSTNVEYPPQDDLVSVECTASESGNLPLAIITLQNNSTGRSTYRVTVTWEAQGNSEETPAAAEVSDEVRSDYIEAGETETLRLFQRSSRALVDTCRVTRIERSGFQLFN
jgi:hypothetical protein